MTGKSAPPREQYLIFAGDDSGREIGEVTSGTQSPSLGCGIGLGDVETAYAKSGTPIEIEIRNRRFPAEVVRRPLFSTPDCPPGRSLARRLARCQTYPPT